MAQAAQEVTKNGKPRSDFNVVFDGYDDESGVLEIEISATCYVKSAPELYDMLNRFALRLAGDVESGRWKND